MHLREGYSPNLVERLSERVHEQRSEHGFGRYTEREKGLRDEFCELRLFRVLRTPP
jgi:hypothetical protein